MRAKADPHHAPNPNPGGASPLLFYVMLGLIIVLLAAFIIIKPHG